MFFKRASLKKEKFGTNYRVIYSYKFKSLDGETKTDCKVITFYAHNNSGRKECKKWVKQLNRQSKKEKSNYSDYKLIKVIKLEDVYV